MELEFIKTSPARNVTVLVKSILPRADQPAVAERLLAPDGVGGEQVGYLEAPTRADADLRLQMMGGEFCGNASMSAAAVLARERGIAEGQTMRFALEVSGADGFVACMVEKRAGALIGRVEMPLPVRVDEKSAPFPRVDLPGITHLIAPADFPKREAEENIRAWTKALNVPALGILLYDEEKARFEPLVYVAATDTRVWEHGCGSGTAAIGCLTAARQNAPCALTLRQPGGEISVQAAWQQNQITKITISTAVRIVAEGRAYLE